MIGSQKQRECPNQRSPDALTNLKSTGRSVPPDQPNTDLLGPQPVCRTPHTRDPLSVSVWGQVEVESHSRSLNIIAVKRTAQLSCTPFWCPSLGVNPKDILSASDHLSPLQATRCPSICPQIVFASELTSEPTVRLKQIIQLFKIQLFF